MSATLIASAVHIFTTRLDTLERLLNTGAVLWPNGGTGYLNQRLAADMHPLGTQIAFACNQPRNFSLWLNSAPADDLEPTVESIDIALSIIQQTKRMIALINSDDAILSTHKRLELGNGLYAELTGYQYLNDFIIPNFYFHMVIAYAILRMSGVHIGKRDYMSHLIPHLRHVAAQT
jgi:uncharacterized protein